MMLYLESNTRPDTSFAVNQCARFTHSIKALHETAVISKFPRIIFWCLIHAKNWWWVFMMMQILRDYGNMKILKTLIVLGVGIYLW